VTRVSVRRARLLLWLGLVLMAPMPLFTGVVTGLMPAARVVMLAGICLLVMLIESTKGAVGLLFLMLAAEALAQLLVLFAIAHLLAWLLGRLTRPRGLVAATVALLLVGVVLSSAFRWYRTPFRAASTHSSLLEVFE
jgi:hypothetical protein